MQLLGQVAFGVAVAERLLPRPGMVARTGTSAMVRHKDAALSGAGNLVGPPPRRPPGKTEARGLGG